MSFRNRCLVAGANKVEVLTVPVQGGREQKAIYKDIRIDEREDWRRRHWRTLFSAYGKAPFFDHYGADLEALFRVRCTYLVDWNLLVLEWLSARLKTPMPNSLGPGLDPGESPDLELADCIKPSNYTEPVPGIQTPSYPQVFQERHGFLPNLSVLDMLLCLGPDAGRSLREAAA